MVRICVLDVVIVLSVELVSVNKMDEDKKTALPCGTCEECGATLCSNCGGCCHCGTCNCEKCHPKEEDNEPLEDTPVNYA